MSVSEEVRPVALRGYKAIRHVAEKRGIPKPRRVGRRGAESEVRCYSLDSDRLAAKLKYWHETGIFPSPYTRSVISDMITALVLLGVNKAHPIAQLERKMKEVMSIKLTKDQERSGLGISRFRRGVSDWHRFSRRRTASKTGVRAKILKQAMMMRRIDEDWDHPVGLKLKQMGACIDIFRVGRTKHVRDCNTFLRLNTFCVVPVKDWFTSSAEIPPVDMGGKTLGPRPRSAA